VVGERAVEPEPVAEDHQGRGHRRAHVAHHLAHEGVEPVGIDRGGVAFESFGSHAITS